MDKKSKIYIAGHTGLIGSAIVRKYKQNGYLNLILKSRQELNLTNQNEVESFFIAEKPEFVIVSAAKVGGIKANMIYPFDFMYENLAIQNNIIRSSLKHGVKKLLYISCGCAYPTKAKTPIKEESLLTNIPEPTNEGFALAKIVGIKLCEKIFTQYNKSFISCIPANAYGINDHFEAERSHVVPAMIKKFHLAKVNNLESVTLWGTGRAEREFIYVDDLAEGILFLMDNYNMKEVINIGSGQDISIEELAFLVKEIVRYKGKILFDDTKPDGMMKRILDSSKIKKMGFGAKTSMKEGLRKSYLYFLKNQF